MPPSHTSQTPYTTHNPLLTKLSALPRIFSPTTTSLFTPPSELPWSLRWRLFLLQPINILAALLTCPNWLFRNRYSVAYIPTREKGSGRRCLVYLPPRPPFSTSDSKEQDGERSRSRKGKRPLHISLHGGAWIGGLPEQDSRFCSELSDRTGAVVLALTYPIAPVHVFPSAHNDVEDCMSWILRHAEELWDVDLNLLTVGGSSVGGNLGLSVARKLWEERNAVQVQGFLGFYVPVDFRVRTGEKKKPKGFPEKDPLGFLFPIFDAYVDWEGEGGGNVEDERLNPTLLGVESLPKRMLVHVAAVDILISEQLEFVERVKGDIERRGNGNGTEERRIEVVVEEKGFHGWLELPSFVMEKERMETFNRAIGFIKDVHQRCRDKREEI